MKKVYFIGIKGVGMASLAIIAKQAGIDVGGSDVKEEFITDSVLKKENIIPFVGFSPDNFDSFIEKIPPEKSLVITTSAHGGLAGIEALHASRRGYQVVTHGNAVGLFMRGKILNRNDLEGVSIAGSHGKTTITAMIATSLVKAGLDPSYTAGTSEIFPIGPAGHYGKGKYFIAEADEYVSDINNDRIPKILYQYPKYAVINNIDFDHPDYYKNITEVQDAFIKFTLNIDHNGVLVINGDDDRLKSLTKKSGSECHIITFGSNPINDYYITRFVQEDLKSYFSVESKNIYIGEFSLMVPGFHNAKNSLAVIALLMELGIPLSRIQSVLPLFKGTKRRMEFIGKNRYGSLVFDDYAHHPQEIKTTLSAVKSLYPRKKIICIFQPHTFSRTRVLFNDFLTSFQDADNVLLLPVFASARESKKESLEFEQLFDQIQSLHRNIIFLKRKEDVIEYVNNNYMDKNYVILTIGAGDVYKLGKELTNI